MSHSPLVAEALIVVDAQQAFMTGVSAVPDHARLQHNIGILLERARNAGALIIFLQNDGPMGVDDEPGQPGWELHFTPNPGEYTLRKTEDDGFQGTDLHALLTAAGIHKLVICGVLSEMCVAATARTAMMFHYTVILPHDAHATYDVPPGPGGSAGVPAAMAARAAEWSLGDEIIIAPSVAEIGFAVCQSTGSNHKKHYDQLL